MSNLSNKHIVLNGRASFYACILEDLKKAAHSCGWALGLHGSLQSDMDIMAMPWTEDATSVEVMIMELCDCFVDSPYGSISCYEKPNNRVVYTIPIYKNWYLDINVIEINKYKGVVESGK